MRLLVVLLIAVASFASAEEPIVVADDRPVTSALAVTAQLGTAFADAMAALGGVPDYPYVVVPHPLGSLTMEQLRGLAAKAAPVSWRK